MEASDGKEVDYQRRRWCTGQRLQRASTRRLRGNEHFDSNRLLAALKTLKKGDFSIRLPVAESVVGAAIAEAFNDLADLLETDTRETARIARVVGKEGRITQRANLGAATGAWADRIESINTLTGDLVQPPPRRSRTSSAASPSPRGTSRRGHPAGARRHATQR